MSHNAGSEAKVEPETHTHHVFGDESAVDDVVAYGVVVVPSGRVDEILAGISQLKGDFGTTCEAEIHCRALLHKHRRAKSPWSHLSEADVWRLLGTLSRLLLQTGARFHAGILDPTTMPKEFRDEDGIVMQRPRTKEFVLIAYMAAVLSLNEWIGLDRLRLWVDPDTSLMDLYGRRSQVRLAMEKMFVNPASGVTLKVNPETPKGPMAMLLEAADVLSYVTAQAASQQASRNKERSVEVFRVLSPSLSCAVFDEHGLRVGTGRNAVPAFLRSREVVKRHGRPR